MRYEIDNETFAIRIFEDGKDIPFQYQPDYPNGDPFDSYEEAESWAIAAVAAHDPEVQILPPDGKGLQPKNKLPNRYLELKQKMSSGESLTADETQELLRYI